MLEHKGSDYQEPVTPKIDHYERLPNPTLALGSFGE